MDGSFKKYCFNTRRDVCEYCEAVEGSEETNAGRGRAAAELRGQNDVHDNHGDGRLWFGFTDLKEPYRGP